MKNLPVQTRTKIQEFVATHEDCRVVFGPTWLAWSVILMGFEFGTSKHILLGRPRSSDAADQLHHRATILVGALEREKAIQRAKREAGK